jgi:hypothetical protein
MLAIHTAFSPETKQHRSSIEHSTLVQKKRKAGISASASEFCTLLFLGFTRRFGWISTHLSNIPLLVHFSYIFFFVVFLFVYTASVDFNCFQCFDSPGNTASLVATTAASSALFILATTAAGSGTGIYGMHIERQGFTVTSGLSSFSLFPYLQHYIFSFLPVLKVKRNIAAMQPPRLGTERDRIISILDSPIFLQPDHMDP